MGDNLNPQQFTQLSMFMTPSEIIDSTHKSDTNLSWGYATPRAQWEAPGSGEGESRSLRDEKAHGGHYASYEEAGPLKIEHDFPNDGESMLVDGHHRLAKFEDKPYLAVEHKEYSSQFGRQSPSAREA